MSVSVRFTLQSDLFYFLTVIGSSIKKTQYGNITVAYIVRLM